MRKVILMHGISGSGKSTLCKQMYEDTSGIIISTDDYWIRPDGYYDFNIERIGKAHQWAQKEFSLALEKRIPYIYVDNTNLNWKEIKYYAIEAAENGYTPEIVEASTPWRYDVDELFNRNTHRVPREAIERMLQKKQSIEHLRDCISGLDIRK